MALRTKSVGTAEVPRHRSGVERSSEALGSSPTHSARSGPGFVFSEEFPSLTLDDVCELPAGASLYADRDIGEFDDRKTAGFDPLGATALLSPAGERFLFRKLNYLKYLVSRRLAADEIGGEERPDPEPSDDELLADAEACRRRIAECNLRLVASIARRFAAAQSDFDELLSEGNVILLKAIDRFDYSRGFRFSTYLTYSVQRHLFRVAALRSRRRSVEVASSGEMLDSAAAPISEEEELPVLWDRVEELVRRMDECLTQREQWIVRERFGLGSENGGRPFREIAEEAGLSKERVRQIQLLALRKLKEFLMVIEGERAEAVLA